MVHSRALYVALAVALAMSGVLVAGKIIGNGISMTSNSSDGQIRLASKIIGNG